ncbi:DUF829-domain-containing protein [Massarina eburnea CBS 473.64]|uniref:DUF829-domain-containing protein n=1 Tax=Massarina eburnea CBS 473.64 TaxID=1395130 RepID=A0A6A6RFI1_9PLEO|nr:DUF829-domain-containing protein [Massarina eburnea CBS 473.64]
MQTSKTPTKTLAGFLKIGHNTYLYTPASYDPTKPLILLFSWNAAAAKHIAKYTACYQKLFPTARIVLVRCFTADIFRLATAHQRLTPALDTVRDHVNAGGEVLVHSFSNGGGTQVVEFAKEWKKSGVMLPMRAQIIDSAPGKGEWKRSHAAIVASLPRTWLWRLVGSALVHLVLTLTFIFDTLFGKENIMVTMCRQLNSVELFDVRVPRVYLYSKTDEMVGWEEVEEHADEAEAVGRSVTTVKFETSAHAGHVREDEGKYWGAVMDAWKMGPRLS